MTKILIYIACSCAFVLAPACSQSSSETELSPASSETVELTVAHPEPNHVEAIRQTFERYREALLSQDGKQAVREVDKASIDYYTTMLDKSLSASESEVKRLSLMDKLMVLSIRARVDRETLEAMNGTDLFVYAVENGWIGADSVRRLVIAPATVHANQGRAPVISNGEETPFKLLFHLENEDWKLNIPSLSAMAEPAMKHVVSQSGYEEDDFLILLLQQITGTRPDDSIWDPPR